MRWEDLPESTNVEDRRGGDSGGFGGGPGGGFGGGIPGGAGGLSIGTILILGLIGYATGIDPGMLIRGVETFQRQQPQVQQPQMQPKRTGPSASPKDETGKFVVRILGSNDVMWKEIFAKEGRNYRPPILVLYNQVTQASCGGRADARMGPFYCPADFRIYLDTSFFQQIERRFKGCDVGSPACRFAQAYVIAHEVGHHVQNLLGILQRSQQMQRNVRSKADANRIQVRVELQADCFAGMWAKRYESRLEPGDIEAALRTAAAIGDDALQRQSTGRVVPDSFTHGSSAQRQRWFDIGFRQGTVAACNTFAATSQL
jgi:predicted metalloprotease